MLELVLLGIRESLLALVLYSFALYFNDDDVFKSKKLDMTRAIKFIAVYTTCICILHYMQSPMYNVLVSYMGLLIGSRLLGLL